MGCSYVPSMGGGGAAGPGSRARFGEDVAVGVSELDAVFVIGVAGDSESSLVVQAMVFGAEADQVPRVSDTVSGPVDHVVDFDDPIALAARNAAAGVAVFDEAAGAVGDDVLRSADGDADTVDERDGRHQHVAGDAISCCGGDQAIPVVGDVAVLVHVEVHPVAAAPLR
jgi:hypothetical protein